AISSGRAAQREPAFLGPPSAVGPLRGPANTVPGRPRRYLSSGAPWVEIESATIAARLPSAFIVASAAFTHGVSGLPRSRAMLKCSTVPAVGSEPTMTLFASSPDPV